MPQTLQDGVERSFLFCSLTSKKTQVLAALDPAVNFDGSQYVYPKPYSMKRKTSFEAEPGVNLLMFPTQSRMPVNLSNAAIRTLFYLLSQNAISAATL
ncbi:CIC11C00000005071 [Sungouiella intermedia]|uniref:CIC11C00000005071 n=1 Tax=Sungouiella intermedia TaxID=45354 RepID=A0A1L0BR17_9ASCO|nr:CIC11C00000005071 [[Candida] intermedia]